MTICTRQLFVLTTRLLLNGWFNEWDLDFTDLCHGALNKNRTVQNIVIPLLHKNKNFTLECFVLPNHQKKTFYLTFVAEVRQNISK